VLPSLLRYVDHDLMRNSAAHNHPPSSHATCNICLKPWNSTIDPAYLNGTSEAAPSQYSVTTTFLPLEPCGHWVHYTCLIWLATRSHDRKGKCPTCGMQLFEWEGITALTLATRSSLNIATFVSRAIKERGQPPSLRSDMAVYEMDCEVIETMIHSQFFLHLGKPPKNADRSPDLVQCFYDVLNALQRMGKPVSGWLQYKTETGYALWCALVAIKMRRYLVEGHNTIQNTEAWRQFEDGRKVLQTNILAEVH
ncbi:hypothetical protein EK21DRAFT_31717, partial [Setomelanomma holmii]